MYIMIDCAAASGDEPGAAIFMSVFLVKRCFIAIGAEQDVRHPFRGSAHLFTYSIEIHTGITFDDQFVMDVSDDEAVPESFHGIAEYVSADSLHDVLHELRTVGFYAFPLLCGAYSFVGDGFAAILIFSDTWLHVGEKTA